MNNSLIALVTGAARGIGYACAEAISETGARMVLADINGEDVRVAAETLGNGAAGMACDVRDPSQVGALFDRIEADFGPASLLVNHAGIAVPAPFLETTPEQFRQVIDVNLTGTFLVTQRAAKTMVAKGIEGTIVNMSSVNAQVAIPTVASYCASKGGVMQLT